MDDANDSRLNSIVASDGRRIDIHYKWIEPSGVTRPADADGYKVERVVANGRTWTYGYNERSFLTTVTLPDGTYWQLSPTSAYPTYQNLGSNPCEGITWTLAGNSFQYDMTHPSGAQARFHFKTTPHGRANVFPKCDWDSYWRHDKARSPGKYFVTVALDKKEVWGPGVPLRSWVIERSDAGSDASWQGENTGDTIKTVSVTDSAGEFTRYTFSNDYAKDEGKLLKLEVGGSPAQILSTTQYFYDVGHTIPSYVQKAGTYAYHVGINPLEDDVIPLYKTVTTQDGTSFSWQATAFDQLARPTRVVRSSSVGFSRTESSEYYDDLPLWVLGQPKKVTCAAATPAESDCDGGADSVVSETVYGWKALPWKTFRFDKPQQVFSYHTTGTSAGNVSSVTDGRGNKTLLTSWKRGIPQSITYADGAKQSAQVNDDGTIAWVTDENDSRTCYQYDSMGRLTRVTYPSESSANTCSAAPWNITTQSFAPIATSEYGIPAGHWRQDVATGNGRKKTYFDALWRPLLVREYDSGNLSATERFTRFAYDHEGRVTFASYPSTSSSPAKGVHSTYDALGRPTYVRQDSELDLDQNGTLDQLVTRTEYLNNVDGYYTKVTNPRGQITRTWYQAFDQPNYETPTAIRHPEGAVTHISRDIFGKPIQIRRSNSNDPSGGTVAVDRNYVYNGSQELCRVNEPETGDTYMGYDAAGNLAWSAAGYNSTGTGCLSASQVAARRVDRSYDARNRLKTLTFPDGNGNQQWSYWPNGQVRQVTTQNDGVAVYNSYTYFRRGLLIGESQSQADGEARTMGYTYNPNGHLSGHRYPTGQEVAYEPNALGQPGRAGVYATGASYYPNGALKQFTYGNGIVHTLSQNARGLPDTSTDAYGSTKFLSDSYDYDANGNVAAITDGATGRNQRGNRDMVYDGLDRLTSTISPMFGTATYAYDVLDNLTRVSVSGGASPRNHYYCYNSQSQLAFVRTGAVCSGGSASPAAHALSYDPQGNLSQKNAMLFDFDYGNRLREAAGEHYRYDGHGRRVQSDSTAGKIGSMYDQGGVLRYQKNRRKDKATEYIMLGGSLVAKADWPVDHELSTKDYVTWTPVPGVTRYVIEESVDGLTWTTVYEGSDTDWASLARPEGVYTYRVLACTDAGVCTEVTTVAHVQRPAVSIVPMLYQLLLN
ncbi:type IV secretion protein Rhs [Lysobacter maris]|uniref:Type IV secretion protein Rhs n=2 Tax=Marilutibacter maris TaxID=1605891 RepID=A0A2U9T2M3_9GAMM|nr:type IV secretion protein Rhs [Lysobacter maris]